MRTQLLVPALFALVGLLPGCEGITGPSEAERKIAAEQAVIKRYSDEVPKVDALLATFLGAWKSANEKKELKAYKEDIEANVLPALDRFVAAAAAMPADSPELAAIHAPLVTAYKAAQAAHLAFVKNVTETTMDVEYAKVLAAMDDVSKAEEVYLAALSAYYKANRVDLQQGR
jgi:hypothetical protein